MRLPSLFALCLIAGCADSNSVVSVRVESATVLDGVDHAEVRVSNLTTGRAADPFVVPARSPTLPPPLTFALVFDASVRGVIVVAVDVLDASHQVLASGEASVAVAPSRSYSLTVFVGSVAPPDLSVTADLSGADSAVPDLVDLASVPTLTQVSIQRAANKADILFVVDNTGAAAQIQQQFRTGVASLADAVLAAPHPASYHIGLITQDIGAGATGAPGCWPFPGLDAQLIGVGAVAEPGPSCQPLGNNLRYVDFDQTAGTSNLPAGETLRSALSCMAAVGTTGCGFRHHLEAMHRALDGTVTQNAGFLRPDAVLALVWFTIRDDCSGLPTTDVFDRSLTDKYGSETVYRCHFGIQCGSPPTIPPLSTPSDGGLSDCVGATGANGGLYFDVSRYLDFLTLSSAKGGVKADPSDVIAATVAAPLDVSVVLTRLGSGTTGAYTYCSPYAPGSCEPEFEHSCIGTFPTGGAVGADPPVRLHQVVSAVQSRFGAACLPGALKSPAAPYCVVNDVTIGGPTPTLAEIPSCSASGNATPCWRLQTNSACPALVDSLGQIEQLTMVVDRVGSPPPNTAPVAACELQ